MINGGQTPGSDGVTSLNLLTGALELIAGTNITLDVGADTITINAADAAAAIRSINTSTAEDQTLVSSNTDILTVNTNAGTGETIFSLITGILANNLVQLNAGAQLPGIDIGSNGLVIDPVTSLSSILNLVLASTQTQINNLASGYNSFSAVAVATANKVLATPGATNWDGITPSTGDVVFLLPSASGGNQTIASEGGLYTYNGAASPLTRILAMSTWTEITGSRIFIDAGGATFENTVWLNTNNNAGTINVTAVTYLQNYNNYIAGSNLSLVGNTFSLITSPALTGTPTAPTPLGTDSTTQIATTASILNKTLTGLTQEEDRIVETDTILQALSRLSYVPTFTALRIESNSDVITLGVGLNKVGINISGATGINTVKFPGGGVTSTSVIGIAAPSAGTALSYIGTNGIQNTITVINQVLTGLSVTNSAIVASDSILISSGKAQGQIDAANTTLALKANIGSPTFTGIPAAPTAAPGTSTTQLATTAFVAAAAAAGVTSFNTRIGPVVSAINDYSFSQISGTATLAQGGTGQITANAALNALLPSQTGNANKILKTDATNSSWVDASSLGEVFNNAGNTPNSLVIRDLFGGLQANSANSSNTANQIGVGPDTTDTVAYPVFVNNVGPSFQGARTNTNFNYNAVTNTLTVNVAGYATTTALTSGLALKADIASPTFTGSPAAPTPTAGDNTTKLATTAFVSTAISSLPSTTNSFTNDISTNTMTSVVNGVSSSATLLSGVSLLFNAPNTMRVQVNDFISDSIIILNNSLSLTGTSLTSAVNGVNSGVVAVSPNAQSITSSITFTNLDEKILLIAPSINAIGTYSLQLKGTGQELNIIFSVSGNSNTSYNYSTINIINVTDTTGNITQANISNFILFRGFVRNVGANNYFAVTFSMPGQLVYTAPLSMTVWQYGASYLNENSTLTNLITTDIANLVSLAPADLSFKMKVNIVPVTTSNPQGYLYSPCGGSTAIFQYSINNLTGSLTALSPTSIASSAYKVAITPLRNYLYAVAATGTSLFQYRISSTNGTLSALSPPSVTTTNAATGLGIDPTGRFLYVCGFGTGLFSQYTITPSTGQLVAIAGAPTAVAQMQDLAIHPSGKFLYAVNNSNGLVYQYSINQSTGALVALGTPTISAGSGPLKIVVHPSGLYVYVANNTGGTISQFSVNTTTGQLTAIGTAFSAGAGVQGLAISSNGLFIYYGCATANILGQSAITPATGLIAAPTTSASVSGARECCFDYSGSFIYVYSANSTNVAAFSINQTTGAMTSIGVAASGVNSSGIAAA